MTFKPMIAVVFLAAPAVAADFDVAGTGHGKASSEVMAAADDLVVVHAMTTYEGFEAADPDSPMNGLHGPCFGAILIKAGQASGGGNCNYSDGDGDVAIMSWVVEGLGEGGRTVGSWAIAGGTGKWAEATGGGSFDAGQDAAGVYTNMITGSMSMP